MVVVVLAIVGISLYWWADSAPSPSRTVVYDWRLKITIHDARTRANYTLPAGIGVAGGIWVNRTLEAYGPLGFSPVSTRDDSGTVYIQSTAYRAYTFGDFFNVYGHRFDTQCVPDGRGGDYCSNQYPPVMVDGDNGVCPDACCINRHFNLSNNKDWLIIIGSTQGVAIGCSNQ